MERHGAPELIAFPRGAPATGLPIEVSRRRRRAWQGRAFRRHLPEVGAIERLRQGQSDAHR